MSTPTHAMAARHYTLVIVDQGAARLLLSEGALAAAADLGDFERELRAALPGLRAGSPEPFAPWRSSRGDYMLDWACGAGIPGAVEVMTIPEMELDAARGFAAAKVIDRSVALASKPTGLPQ